MGMWDEQTNQSLSKQTDQPTKLAAAQRFRLTCAVLLAAFSAALAAVIMSIGLPVIVDSFGTRQAVAHWLVTGYTCAGTLSMLLTPWFTRRFGVRSVFIWTLSMFSLASIFCAVSPSLWLLIGSRIVQGMASGLMTTLALIVMAQAYPLEQRGRAMAAFGIGVVLAPMLGPAAGGAMMQFWGWKSLMLAPLPFSVFALVMGAQAIPRGKVSATVNPFDWWGFGYLFSLLVVLLGGISQLQMQKWPLVPTLVCAALTVFLTGLFFRHERRYAWPLIDLRLFKVKAFAAAGCVALVYGFGVWGSAYFLPLYLQMIGHHSPLQTGLILLPGGVVMMLMIPIAGRMADSKVPHQVVMLGLLCFAAGCIALAVVQSNTLTVGLVCVTTLVTLSRGVGLGIMIPALDATASRTLAVDAAAEGLAIMNFLRQLGGAMSPALVALVLEQRTEYHQTFSTELPALVAGYRDTLALLGMIFLCAVAPAWKMRLSRERSL